MVFGRKVKNSVCNYFYFYRILFIEVMIGFLVFGVSFVRGSDWGDFKKSFFLEFLGFVYIGLSWEGFVF